MKNILKSSIFALMLVAFGACENDIEAVATPQSGATLLTPASGTEIVLLQSKENEIATTLVWDYSDFGVETSATYIVEIAEAGTDFAKPIVAGTTTSRFLSWSVKELNGVLLSNEFKPYVQSSIDVRILAQLGTAANALKQYSNFITLKVTPYTSELPQLAVPGNHQGWKPLIAPRIASSAYGKTDYQGFVWLDGGHKFIGPDADGVYDFNAGPDYGDDGTFTGKLKIKPNSNIIATSGYYFVEVNTTALSYKETLTTWGIIGDATPGEWSNSTAMTYDATTKVWTVTADLIGGKEMKFRANNAWDLQAGHIDKGTSELSGVLVIGSNENTFIIPSSGTYKVTLDLSHPRAYTYTLEKK